MARILIAEDESGLRSLVARALAQDGHLVTTASDGGEALDIMTRECGRFELLLTDIRMPVMDGIPLALAAARDHPDIAILLMTGYADQRERACGLEQLIHDVVTKPFSLAIIRSCGQRRPGGGLATVELNARTSAAAARRGRRWRARYWPGDTRWSWARHHRERA
jgi:two-component system cell cycle response regulator CpdR